jgi:hypothetical protein
MHMIFEGGPAEHASWVLKLRLARPCTTHGRSCRSNVLEDRIELPVLSIVDMFDQDRKYLADVLQQSHCCEYGGSMLTC